jgi:fumarate hydratase class I
MNSPSELSFQKENWVATLTDLVRRTSTRLPDDVLAALRKGAETAEMPRAATILSTICQNADLAARNATPMCQDTGTLTFWVEHPAGVSQRRIAAAIREAVAASTHGGFLRQNTILPVDGRSVPENVADGAPSIHFEEVDDGPVRVSLLLKGGGCENMSCQYSLPDASLSAGRDLAGVRACILHAVWRAQGMGCAPGILGVCIGGDRAEGYAVAKKQLLRPLDDISPDPVLSQMEQKLLDDANTLEIGPMGLGGRTTLLGVKLAGVSRLPASFFVTVAYSCWACRRATIFIDVATGRETEVRR